jgi:anaerobic dimethyl sulfoxide reductase subunit B (iron-sulfur subunit)
MRVTTTEEGKFPNLFVSFLTNMCYHCATPGCIAACPVNAITKGRQNGIVVVDRQKCLGKDQCTLCLEACPYGAPQFGSEANAKMQKCDLCLDRLEESKQPICVAGCPMRALDAGPLPALKAKYGREQEAYGFDYSRKVKPCVVFRPKVKPAPGEGAT